MNNRLILAKPNIIALIAGIFLFILLGETSARADEKEIDINTKMNPSGYLFEVGNLKPGDWMPREITISNEGIQDFKYMAVLGKKRSVKGLLEELDLIVKKNEEVLYEGKMDKFTGFTPRNLAKGEAETLFFQVTMPYDLGNAFQSSGAEVEIVFVAEALEDTGGGNPGEENPGGEEPPSDDGSEEGELIGEDTDDGDSSAESSEEEEQNEEDIDGSHPNEEDQEAENSGEERNEEAAETNSPTDTITVSPEIRENLLPKTATNTYNILLIGSFLFVIGSILLFFYNRKVRNNK